MTDAILTLLKQANCSMEAWEIAQQVGVTPREAAALLHRLQDEDRVFMRNGFYSLSAKQRQEMGNA